MAEVIWVGRSSSHSFSKQGESEIELIAGEGVAGDAHRGQTVKHRSRVAKDPTQPNLRQVHLIHEELFAELRAQDFSVSPGDLGENVTTRGIDLLSLPRGTLLAIGATVKLEITGLRNPCAQIDAFQPGLLGAVLSKTDHGLVRKSGVMAIVLTAGPVKPNDEIVPTLPNPPHVALERV